MKVYKLRKLCQLTATAAWLIPNVYLVSCRDQKAPPTNSIDSLNKATSIEKQSGADNRIISERPALYKDSCGICHAIWKTDNYLAGIVERLGTDYLKLYITKQDSLIKAKNKYALEVKDRYGNLASVHNYKFTNEQLDSIVLYLKKYSH